MRRMLLVLVLTACSGSSQNLKPAFVASPHPVTTGQSSTLSWQVEGADLTLNID